MKRSALRRGLYIFGGVLVAAAALLLLLCGSLGLALRVGIPGVVLMLALAVEQWRYKRLATPRPGPAWEATGERFVDPETGRFVTVYFHPASGERRYVADEAAAAPPPTRQSR
jgi:hypothetical protein